MASALLLLAALAGDAGAAEPPPPVAPAPVAVGAVEIRLVDDSGAAWAGLEGASVVLRRGDEAVTLAPAGERFVAAAVPAGPWTLDIDAWGFLPAEADVEVRAGELLPFDIPLAADLSAIETLEVVALTDGQRLQRSAQAVTVVETEAAQQQSADLGEVMARTAGVGVRRSGGLGSDARFSLNGLTDDQVRFFLDGAPLDLAGYPYGISNVPVDLVERVEVYRGVVPIRFGADALGGAVNLVTEAPGSDAGGSVAWQGGSFGTHRLGAHAHVSDEASGLFARGSAYLDRAKNDYPIDVEVPDDVGQLSATTVRRFHDAYAAGGGSLELGVADRPWADVLSVRGFGSGFRREHQHNVVMTVPYGEPVSRLATGGGTAAWRHGGEALHVDVTGGYTWTERAFTDLGACVYDWFGECARERATPGEISSPGADQVVWDEAIVGRASLAWRPSPAHQATLALAPTYFTRSGQDLLHEGDGRDPLTSQRDALQLVGGLEHQLDAWEDRLQNLVFVKYYGQSVASEEPAPGGGFRDVDRTTHRFGVGDSLRVTLAHWIYVKASYEAATRLPTPEEIFGDAVLVVDNLALGPETSHNLNLGATTQVEYGRVGKISADANGFLRDADDLIVLLGNDRSFTYFNVYGARSVGVEGAVTWTSPGDWVTLDGNATWTDLRNTSREGTFGDYAGDRIPNRPWLFVNGAASVGASDVVAAGDRLTLDGYTRYVHGFYRGWESIGLSQFKQQVPAQLSHTVALTYAADARRARVSGSVEVQNLTDADLYDFFGVQRPGRAVFGKLTVAR